MPQGWPSQDRDESIDQALQEWILESGHEAIADDADAESMSRIAETDDAAETRLTECRRLPREREHVVREHEREPHAHGRPMNTSNSWACSASAS